MITIETYEKLLADAKLALGASSALAQLLSDERLRRQNAEGFVERKFAEEREEILTKIAECVASHLRANNGEWVKKEKERVTSRTGFDIHVLCGRCHVNETFNTFVKAKEALQSHSECRAQARAQAAGLDLDFPGKDLFMPESEETKCRGCGETLLTGFVCDDCFEPCANCLELGFTHDMRQEDCLKEVRESGDVKCLGGCGETLWKAAVCADCFEMCFACYEAGFHHDQRETACLNVTGG